MRIACLAWGSLIWKSQPLVLASPWQQGGPLLPIEFARVGDAGELATVVCPGAADAPTRWALLASTSLDEARDLLRRREGIPAQQPQFIADAPAGQDAAPFGIRLATWARQQGLDAVVWTALPPRFAGHNGRAPTADEAVAYLQGLRGSVAAHAEHYVRNVPAEIRTPTRHAIEERLGWTAQ